MGRQLIFDLPVLIQELFLNIDDRCAKGFFHRLGNDPSDIRFLLDVFDVFLEQIVEFGQLEIPVGDIAHFRCLTG